MARIGLIGRIMAIFITVLVGAASMSCCDAPSFATGTAQALACSTDIAAPSPRSGQEPTVRDDVEGSGCLYCSIGGLPLPASFVGVTHPHQRPQPRALAGEHQVTAAFRSDVFHPPR